MEIWTKDEGEMRFSEDFIGNDMNVLICDKGVVVF